MPMPMPEKGQKQDDFMAMCMADKMMMADFKDNDQRLAVCFSQWRKEHPEDKPPAEEKGFPGEIERRGFAACELRAESEGNGDPMIRGYAAMFNQLSDPILGFREQVAPGCFAESLKADDIRALFNHNPDAVLGRTSAKTLRLKEDAKGLAIEIDPPDTQIGRDVMAMIKRGDINQMSFGFICQDEAWEKSGQTEAVRTLRKVKLFDVSPVTFPAYPQTTVAVRDRFKAIQSAEKPGGQGVPETGRVDRRDKTRLNYGYPKN